MLRLPAWLITSDWHLRLGTEFAYRWKVINRVIKEAQEQDNIPYLLILGDLTDDKNNHSAELVNQIIKSLNLLLDTFERIVILRGNHDYEIGSIPFFDFLNSMDRIDFVTYPDVIYFEDGTKVAMLPSTGKEDREWIEWKPRIMECDFICMHHILNGVTAENGHKITGGLSSGLVKMLREFMKKGGIVYSGDIHKPQKWRGVYYVGAPHSVRYGDLYEPRYIVHGSTFDQNEEVLSVPFIQDVRKYTIHLGPFNPIGDLEEKNLAGFLLKKGDRVKLEVKLRSKDLPNWGKISEKLKEIVRISRAELKQVHLSIYRKDSEEADLERLRSLHYDPRRLIKEHLKKEGLDKDQYFYLYGEDMVFHAENEGS